MGKGRRIDRLLGGKQWLLVARLLAIAATVPAHAQTATHLRIGVQFGLGYLPFHVASQASFIEKRVSEQGLTPVAISFVHVTGSPQINDGLLSGNIEIGSGGYTAMMVFCDRTKASGDAQLLGVTALSNVPYDLYTVDPNLKSLKDLDRDKHKIGLPAVKVSVPAVYLQMAAEQIYGVGKHNEFDALTVSLAQPDGAMSLLSGGGAVNSYTFAPPFSNQVKADAKIHKVWSSNEMFGSPATALSSWTTVKFRRENPKLYVAVIAAMKDSMELIAKNPKRAAEIYLKAEKSKLSVEFITEVLANKAELRYTLAPEQSAKLADFLHRIGSLKTKPDSWKDFFFPELHNEQGN
jgi:NitT/TauT family transport system substrate-binding protein